LKQIFVPWNTNICVHILAFFQIVEKRQYMKHEYLPTTIIKYYFTIPKYYSRIVAWWKESKIQQSTREVFTYSYKKRIFYWKELIVAPSSLNIGHNPNGRDQIRISTNLGRTKAKIKIDTLPFHRQYFRPMEGFTTLSARQNKLLI